MTDLFQLGLQIVTRGIKEAKQELDAVDDAGKKAAQGVGTAEGALGKVGNAATTATSGLSAVKGEMASAAAQALGMDSSVGQAALSMGGLGLAAAGVGAAVGLLVWVFKDIGLSASIAEEHADKLTEALGRQKQAADAATVAGARLALQEARNSLGRAPTGPGIMAGLKVSAANALGGFGLAGAVSVEEMAKVARQRKLLTDGVTQAENNLAEAIKRTGDSAAHSDNQQMRALATLIKTGNAVGNNREQALLLLQGLNQSLKALPVSDTIGRAGLVGQIKELNDALFPKLHAHVAKLGKGLKDLKQASPLATGPHVGITPSGDDRMAAAQSGGVVATDTIFGKMKNIHLDEETKRRIEEIHRSSQDIAKAWEEAQNHIADIVSHGMAQTLGDAIFNAFAAAFNGEGVGGILKAFSKTILAGVGQMFTQLGMVYLEYGVIMQSLSALLPNPFTAGPAGIAIGAALIAMGSALGAVAHGGGGRGTAQAGAFRENNNNSNVVRLKFIDRQGNPMDGMKAKAPIYNTFIGVNDPAAQRALMEMIEKGARR